jgi:hypothetical protein
VYRTEVTTLSRNALDKFVFGMLVSTSTLNSNDDVNLPAEFCSFMRNCATAILTKLHFARSSRVPVTLPRSMWPKQVD